MQEKSTKIVLTNPWLAKVFFYSETCCLKVIKKEDVKGGLKGANFFFLFKK